MRSLLLALFCTTRCSVYDPIQSLPKKKKEKIKLLDALMEWNPSAQLCIWLLLLPLMIKSRAPVCWMRPVVLPSRRWTVCSCEFKRVGERLFPEQSWSWLRHSNPYAPNHTAELSARGYNQGNTSKMSLGSWSASHESLQYGAATRTQTYLWSLSLIAPKYSNAWLIMKEQLGLFIAGFFTKRSSAVLGICKRSTCWFPRPDVRTDGMISGLPAQPECQYLPSPPFCQPFQLLIYATTFLFLLAV